MVIQHNLTSNNTQRQLGNVTNALAKATEKLSSGYKINRAADDAAGLSISEKMRAQIRGLNKASTNIQDGISLIQVAEGALAESHNILQRMNELATQAASDTNTDTDRDALQAETDQLIAELNRTAAATSFNKELFPLLGGYVMPDSVYGTDFDVINNSSANMVIDGVTYAPGSTVTLKNVLQLNNGSRTSTSIAQTQGSSGSGMTTASNFVVTSTSTETIYIKYNTIDDAYFDDDGNIFVNSPFGTSYASTAGYWILGSSLQSSYPPIVAEKEAKYIQSGATSGQAISIPFVNAKAGALGVDPTDLSSFDTAGVAMANIQSAIDQVSSWRSRFGAIQNRLLHAYNIDSYTAENAQAAESRIRDTDMAKEMVEYSKNNILNSAGESVLTQANSKAEYVLNLLQG